MKLDHSRRAHAELERKLRLAVEIEAKAAAEVDRLAAVAYEQGWTIREIAETLGITYDAAWFRSKKGWRRGKAGPPRWREEMAA